MPFLPWYLTVRLLKYPPKKTHMQVYNKVLLLLLQQSLSPPILIGKPYSCTIVQISYPILSYPIQSNSIIYHVSTASMPLYLILFCYAIIFHYDLSSKPSSVTPSASSSSSSQPPVPIYSISRPITQEINTGGLISCIWFSPKTFISVSWIYLALLSSPHLSLP